MADDAWTINTHTHTHTVNIRDKPLEQLSATVAGCKLWHRLLGTLYSAPPRSGKTAALHLKLRNSELF